MTQSPPSASSTFTSICAGPSKTSFLPSQAPQPSTQAKSENFKLSNTTHNNIKGTHHYDSTIYLKGAAQRLQLLVQYVDLKAYTACAPTAATWLRSLPQQSALDKYYLSVEVSRSICRIDLGHLSTARNHCFTVYCLHMSHTFGCYYMNASRLQVTQ